MGFRKKVVSALFEAFVLGFYIYFLNDSLQTFFGGGFWGVVTGIFAAIVVGWFISWFFTRKME